MPGRPLAPLRLTAEERETLSRWTRRATTAQALALRARLVLALRRGLPRMARLLQRNACIASRWASGGRASLRAGWTACSMSRARRAPHDRG